MNTFRIYHLLFAAGCLTAYFTAEELGLVHVWTGYVIATLVTLRLQFGIASRRGFEFRRLLPTRPADWQGKLASLSALALVISVAGTAGTGIAMDQGGTLVGKSIRADDESHERGHEREEEDEALASPSTLFGLVTPARAESEEKGDQEEGPLGEVHETLGNLVLPLAIFHALMLLAFRLDLARFMLFLPRRKA